MAIKPDKCSSLYTDKHWKSRCISLLKDTEKMKLTAQGPPRERDDLLKKKEEEELHIKAIQNKIHEMEKQLKDLENKNSNMEDVRRCSQLKVYKNITKLTFDLDCPSHEIKGFVAGRPLQTFHLDTTLNTNQFIVDYLWNLINPDVI